MSAVDASDMRVLKSCVLTARPSKAVVAAVASRPCQSAAMAVLAERSASLTSLRPVDAFCHAAAALSI